MQDLNLQAQKILVISDSHNNRNVIRKILNSFEKECQLAVFCGDGTRDFLSQVNIPFYAVRGNNDSPQCSIHKGTKLIDFSLSATQIFSVNNKRFFLTHGHLFNIYYQLNELLAAGKEKSADIILYGHSHIASADIQDGILMLNPGSCSLPRDERDPSFCILTIYPDSKISYQFYAIDSLLNISPLNFL